jgi:hypothetical protein
MPAYILEPKQSKIERGHGMRMWAHPLSLDLGYISPTERAKTVENNQVRTALPR